MHITIRHLKKTFGSKTAIDMESYSIQPGEIVGLVGNNGAGKTTLFRLMLDLLRADRGTVELDRVDVSRSEEWKRHTGAYIDSSFLIDYLTPKEYFHFIGKMYGMDKETTNEQLKPFERFMNGEIIEERKLIRKRSESLQR